MKADKMGNQIQYAVQKHSDVHSFLIGLYDLSPEGELLKSTKILKTIKCTKGMNSSLLLLTKVYIKRGVEIDRDLPKYRSSLEFILEQVQPRVCPNLVVSDYVETEKVVVLYRQFAESTLRQKLSKPPYISELEKLWISYQMVQAVHQLHSLGLMHGDINSENFLVTSWNWVFLCDFSYFYKPVHLRESDLTTYKLFFTNPKREACNIAPERFVLNTEDIQESDLTSYMDIFSLGCTIAEVFLGGKPLFTHPTLLAFQRKELEELDILERIKNVEIINLLRPMIARSPLERINIRDCLGAWNDFTLNRVFSPSLYPQFSELIHNDSLKSPDNRILFSKGIVSDCLSSDVGPNDAAVIVPLITSAIRNTSVSSSRLEAIEALVKVSNVADSEVNMDRILPYLVSLITTKEEKSIVKIAALQGVLSTMKNTTKLELKHYGSFQEYIWPSISRLINDENQRVLMSLASSLPEIAKLAKIFMEQSIYERRQSGKETLGFDQEQSAIDKKLLSLFKNILYKDSAPHAQLAMINSLEEFTRNFTSKSAIQEIIASVLPLMNTDEKFKCAIFQQVPKLLKTTKSPWLLHRFSIEENIEDPSEMVLLSILRCLVQVSSTVDHRIIERTLCYLVHPNSWIRSESYNLVLSCIQHYDEVENYCTLRPMILPLLTLPAKSVYLINEECISSHIKHPFTREQFHSYFVKNTADPEDIPLLQALSPFPHIGPRVSSFFKKTNKGKLSFPMRKMDTSSSEEETFGDPLDRSEVLRTQTPGNPFSCNKKKLKITINAHNAAVTHLAGDELNSLVFSASNDSTIRKWSPKQLELRKPVKSEIVYQCSDNKTTRFTSLELRGNFLYVSHEEAIEVIDTEVSTVVSKLPQDKKLSSFRMIDENAGVAIDSRGLLKLYDVRAGKITDLYDIGCQRGITSSLCRCANSFALCVGTYLGYLYVFDLRFNVLSSTLGNSAKEAILSLDNFCPDNAFYLNYSIEKPAGPVILAAEGSKVVAWDLLLGSPIALLTQSDSSLVFPYLRPEPFASPSLHSSLPKSSIYRKKLLKKYSEYKDGISPLHQSWKNFSHRIKRIYENPHTVRSVCCPMNSGVSSKCVLTGSQDNNLRLWNLMAPGNSCIFGHGPETEFKSQQMPDVLVISEESKMDKPLFKCSAKQLKSREFSDDPPHRRTSHSDAILDILAMPGHQLVFSSSRDGTINVWGD